MYLVFTEIIIETDFSKTKNLDKIYFTNDVVSKNSKFNTYETSFSAFIIVALLYYR